MQEITAFLAQKGFDIDPSFDGKFTRFDRAGENTGYFIGKTFATADAVIYTAHFGDWKTGEKFSWQSSNFDQLPDDQKAKIALEFKAARDRARQEEEASQLQVADAATATLEQAASAGQSAYLERKGFEQGQLFNCKLDGEDLLVGLEDADGKTWSYQRISPDGQKRYLKGGRIKGCFHLLYDGASAPVAPAEVYVAEGIATAASVHLATDARDRVTASACHAGNLPAAAKALRAKYPAAKIVLCADDDWKTPGNPGVAKATNACEALGWDNCEARIPCWPEGSRPEKATDWNDMHASLGLGDVICQLTAPVIEGTPGGSTGSGAGDSSPLAGVQSLPVRHSKLGVPMPPSQNRIVHHLLEHFGQNLIKQDRDLFLYTGTHWRLMTMAEHDRLKMLISDICSGLADVKLLDAAYKMFMYAAPSKPSHVDMFTPHPFCANFLDGTLHLLRDREHKFELVFRPHAREDFLINCLPYEYQKAQGQTNAEFLSMLERVFEGDADKAEKIRAVRQMYGACLVPAFPHLYMCYGPPATGKSTILKIAARLAAKDNICHVAPSDFHSFNMETMAGKLVNIDTDIPFDAPMRDEVVKKIIERGSFRVRRKGIKDIYAPLPSVHLFGGNGIPKALDGASRAHDRRWTFIGFDRVVPKGSGFKGEYWDYCFEQSPLGVLAFAVDGLRELCASGGKFTEPASGSAAKEEWQMRSDAVGQFLADVEGGEVVEDNTQLIRGPSVMTERGKAWCIFKKWHEEAFPKLHPPGKHAFFAALRAKNCQEKVIKGVRYFTGFGVRGSQGAEF